MSLSFIIWFSISACLLSFWLWTIYILLKQKKAWKAYADKRKLRYSSNKFHDGPSMSGVIDGYKVAIFTSNHSELDERSQRRLTAIEVSLTTGLTVPSAIASGGMVSIIEGIEIHQEYKPEFRGWDDSYIARTADVAYMQEYLNDDRLNKLVNLMNLDKGWVVLVFIDKTGLLRFDTPLAVDNPRKMDKLIKEIISVAKSLELKSGEDKDLHRRKSKSESNQSVVDIDDDLLSDDIGLELE